MANVTMESSSHAGIASNTITGQDEMPYTARACGKRKNFLFTRRMHALLERHGRGCLTC